MDYILFTNGKTKDDVVYKILDTMVKNKPDLVAVAPVLADSRARARPPQAHDPVSSRRAEILPGQQARSQGLSSERGARRSRRGAARLRRVGGTVHCHRGGVRGDRVAHDRASRTNVLQALLVACVVLWVLDVPRQVFNVSFYTEQLLTVCLGLTLALAFVADTARPPAKFDWGGVIASVGDRRLHRLPLPQIG